VHHKKSGAEPRACRGLLEKHAATLREFLATERGRQRAGYLTQLAEVLLAQHEETAAELASLREGLDRAIGIVATQQRHLRPRPQAPEEPGAA
jgi:hypothetical protein